MQLYEFQEGMMVPAGSKKLAAEVWITGREMIILGDPEEISQEFYAKHNCDERGCGAFGPHVLARFHFMTMAKGPDPECPNCDGTGGIYSDGSCSECWSWRDDPAWDHVKGEVDEGS